jgi:hypothetical protein
MSDTAAHLADHVLPFVPVRQWAPSFPWRVRFLLAYDAELAKEVRRVFMRTVLRFVERRAAGPRGKSGAVNFVQRFGSALNLNVHFHALVLDGAYTLASPFARPVFLEAPRLRDQDVLDLVRKLHMRVLRVLRRRGYLDEDDAPTDPDDALMAQLCAASVEGRVALGPTAGAPVRRFRTDPTSEPTFVPGELCADWEGFSLHAKVRIHGDDRERLERLSRYVARPPIATERLSLTPDGRVAYGLRRKWRDGTTHVVFDPLTFIERLAALVPRPRDKLLTYHGVLAPAAAWRDDVVPHVDEEPDSGSAVPPRPRRPAPKEVRRTW